MTYRSRALDKNGNYEENDITKALKKKDAILKSDFDSLPVIGETKLLKGFEALVLSFHSQRRAAL